MKIKKMQIILRQMMKIIVTLLLCHILVISIAAENITMKIIIMMNVIITSPWQPVYRRST